MTLSPEPLSPSKAAELASELLANVERAVHGKREVVTRAAVCLIARGHLLLEDVPGVGKTTLARALARSLDADFSRVQFTSDLLPGDLTGLTVPEIVDGRPTTGFQFQRGPIFANVVLADEVNRASPKTQSALLEAMSEQTVSIDGTTHALPESQLDRFLMRLSMGYPSREHEARVLCDDPNLHALPALGAVVSLPELRGMQAASENVKVDDSLVGYLLDLIEATRADEALSLGVSTRGALALRRAAQAHALIDGRDFCIPEDIRELASDVLAHRVSVRSRGAGVLDVEEAGWILREIVDRVPVPL